ncbi:hypothetical protein EJB05_43693, partial [Eragrostis curvula]
MASLAILLLLARISSSIAISSNYITRTSEQQVIATVAPVIIPDVDGQSGQPFLTSPSGSYAAYLRLAVDSAAGLAGDSCYVQVQRAGGGGDSVWESDCTPVGGADACDLAFSPVGLELFAGGHSLWDTGLDADPGTLSLDDGGDLSIVGKDGVTVWRASGEPWTGQQCGSPLPTSSSVDALPPPSTTSTKLVTPPAAATLAAGTGGTDFSFGDEPAAPPADTLLPAPDLPAPPPPVDTVPEQPLAPPPADASPDLPLPPPPAYTFPDSPDQPLLAPPPVDMSPYQPLAPPPADVSPDLPLYSSPPPALPPFGIPFAPPTGTAPDTPLPGAATPPYGEPGSEGGGPFSAPPPVGLPTQHGSPHHDLPVGASPPLPVPDTLAPSGHGAGGAGLPFGQGQVQQGQGVFGQQPQLLDGAGHPLEDSSGGRRPSRVAMCAVLAALVILCFGF